MPVGETVGGVPGVDQPEDQQRPVPQVQRARHRPRVDQRSAASSRLGSLPAVRPRIGAEVGARQDQQDGRPDGHQRHGPGNRLTPSISQPQARMAASPTVARVVRTTSGHRTGNRPARAPASNSPGPGEAVVVGRRLIALMGGDRIHERRDGQRAQQQRRRSAAGCPAAGAAERPAARQQQQERDVTLALNRHRPDVLQRTDGFTGPQIVRRGVGQFPVLVVAQGPDLVGKGLPAGLWLDEDGQHRAAARRRPARRQQSADQPDQFSGRGQRRVGSGRTQQSAEEEPDSARKTSTPPETRPNQMWKRQRAQWRRRGGRRDRVGRTPTSCPHRGVRIERPLDGRDARVAGNRHRRVVHAGSGSW